MSELSQGAYLAWRLAAGETVRTLHPCIEKEFVLIGLCGLGRWLRSKAQGENAPLKGQALRAVSTEAQAIEERTAQTWRGDCAPQHGVQGVFSTC